MSTDHRTRRLNPEEYDVYEAIETLLPKELDIADQLKTAIAYMGYNATRNVLDMLQGISTQSILVHDAIESALARRHGKLCRGDSIPVELHHPEGGILLRTHGYVIEKDGQQYLRLGTNETLCISRSLGDVHPLDIHRLDVVEDEWTGHYRATAYNADGEVWCPDRWDWIPTE